MTTRRLTAAERKRVVYDRLGIDEPATIVRRIADAFFEAGIAHGQGIEQAPTSMESELVRACTKSGAVGEAILQAATHRTREANRHGR